MRRSAYVAFLFLFLACSGVKSKIGYLDIEGQQIFYKTLGEPDNEPILVLHGGPGLNHGYLEPGLSDLSEDYYLIFYDQLLCGQSDSPMDSTRVTLNSFIDDVERVRKGLGLERIHLLGHSWGGLLAMHYAIRYEENLLSLILSNSVSPSTETASREAQAMSSRFTSADSLERVDIMNSSAFRNRKASAADELLRINFGKQFYEPTLLKSLELNLQDDFFASSQKFRWMSSDLAQYDLTSDLNALSVPVLVIYGSFEPLGQIAGPLFRKSLRNASMKVIPQSGHFPFIEKPHLFQAQIKDFHAE